MNEQNLSPRALTSEEAREIGRKGGVASGIARRRRRMMRDTLGSMMTAPIQDVDLASQLAAVGFDNSVENAIAFAMLTRAASGDVEAARFCRDTLGEKPSERFDFVANYRDNLDAIDMSMLSNEELAALAGDDDDE